LSPHQSHLERYAELAIRIGLNLQPGQVLYIGSASTPVPVELAPFARLLVSKAYDAGARRVFVQFQDEQISRMTMERAAEEALAEFPLHLARMYEEAADNGAAFLVVYAPNPDLMQGVDPKRLTTAARASQKALVRFSGKLSNMDFNWALISAPTDGWAAKVYPGLPSGERTEALWRDILYTVRADNGDPVAAWQEHLDLLRERARYLNERRFRRLHYRAPGTDLSLELADAHLWLGGENDTPGGITFVPNLPTEEVFSVPRRDGVNGTVRATMPLNYNGRLIEDIELRFEGGRIVDYKASSGYETLKGLIETDDGSHYLGEVALVPVDSPIARLNRLFYNTLFDENAACHLAIGRAYPPCLEGGTAMSKEELLRHGLNDSITHVDFMIGSADLEIDGETANGERVPVFRAGKWAF
jgi:aminopeptidase